MLGLNQDNLSSQKSEKIQFKERSISPSSGIDVFSDMISDENEALVMLCRGHRSNQTMNRSVTSQKWTIKLPTVSTEDECNFRLSAFDKENITLPKVKDDIVKIRTELSLYSQDLNHFSNLQYSQNLKTVPTTKRIKKFHSQTNKSLHLTYNERIKNGYFDETWLNHTLYTDNQRSDCLREKMFMILQKSRAYKNSLPSKFRAVEYDETGDFPKPICVPYLPFWLSVDFQQTIEKRIRKQFLRFNEMIYIEKRHLPFCSLKHDKYHIGLSNRIKSLETERKMKFFSKKPICKNTNGNIKKVTGLPKIKRKPPTIPQDPFKSKSQRQIKRGWLVSSQPEAIKKKQLEVSKEPKENKEDCRTESWVVDSNTMTSRSFLSCASNKVVETSLKNDDVHSGSVSSASISTTIRSTIRRSFVIGSEDILMREEKACETNFFDEEDSIVQRASSSSPLSQHLIIDEDQREDWLGDEGVVLEDQFSEDTLHEDTQANSIKSEKSLILAPLDEELQRSNTEVTDEEGKRSLSKIDEVIEDHEVENDADKDIMSKHSSFENYMSASNDDVVFKSLDVESDEQSDRISRMLPPPKLIEREDEKRERRESRKKSFISIVSTPTPEIPPLENKDTNDARERMLRAMQRKKKAQQRFEEMRIKRKSTFGPIDQISEEEADRRINNFLEPYCIIDPGSISYYKKVFDKHDDNSDGYLDEVQALEALDYILPDVTDANIEYIYRILELVNLPMYQHKMNQTLFNVVVSLTRRIVALDDFMKGLLKKIDFKSLDSKFFHARKMFEKLIDDPKQQTMSIDCLLWEVEAGGLSRSDDREIRQSLVDFQHFDIIDFLTYLPLFTYIHSHVVGNPLQIFDVHQNII